MFPRRGGTLQNRRRRHFAPQATDTFQNIDGRIMIRVGQRPRQHQVPIQNTTHRIGHRFVHVVTFDQDRIQRRDGAGFTRARSLQQTRQQRKDRGRVTARCRRLADREPDLALRHRETRHRIH